MNKRAGAAIISKATLSRFLRADNNGIFTVDPIAKTITLNNHFTDKEYKKNKQPFVIVSDVVAGELMKHNDNFLIEYFLYLDHCLSITKSTEIDNTRSQFLAAFGYSTKSGDNLTRVSSCNTILSAAGILGIRQDHGLDGKIRNHFTMLRR